MRTVFAVALMLLAASAATAQVTQSQVSTTITTNVPSGNPSVLTAASLRAALNQMNTAIFQAQGASGLTISGTPSAGDVQIATGATAAAWGHTFTSPSYIWTTALSGSSGLGNSYQFTTTSDTQQCAFCTQIYSTWNYGGSTTTRGARSNGFFWNIQSSTTSGTGATAGVGITGIGQSNSGDGGTGLTNALVKGTYFGGNLIARNAGTNVQENVGLEADTMTTSTSSQRYNFGVTATNYSATQGSALDAAFAVYSGGSIAASGGSGPWGPGVGYHCGLCFGELSANGLVPLDSGATVIGTHLESLGNIPITNGIDLRGFNISGLAFASPGVALTGSGVLAILTGTSIPAGGATGVGYQFSITSNFGIYFGSGAPTLSAAQGSLYLRSDGTINNRLYINTNGSTTWTAFNTTS